MRKNENSNVLNNILTITRLALVAAMYVALTLAVEPLAFGIVNFRVSEVLVLLCFYRKDYAPALILGCFIANLFSPFGLYDIIFGTLATAIAVIPMYYMKNVFIAALLPIISNGVIVGIELYLFGDPLWLSMALVALGELVIVGIIGTAVFKLIFEKNRVLMNIIGSTRNTSVKNKTAQV